ARRRFPSEQRERLGQQTITCENRDAVAVDDVKRRPATTQRVVVHRGQVVVNQRVGVDQLDGAGRGQRQQAGCIGILVSRHRHGFSRGGGGNGPPPLAAEVG